jgi:hypothetical protein
MMVDLAENIPARMAVVIITMKVAGAAVDAALNLVKLLMQKPKPSLKTKARNIFIKIMVFNSVVINVINKC